MQQPHQLISNTTGPPKPTRADRRPEPRPSPHRDICPRGSSTSHLPCQRPRARTLGHQYQRRDRTHTCQRRIKSRLAHASRRHGGRRKGLGAETPTFPQHTHRLHLPLRTTDGNPGASRPRYLRGRLCCHGGGGEEAERNVMGRLSLEGAPSTDRRMGLLPAVKRVRPAWVCLHLALKLFR